jgi:hypothetical protein
VDFGLSPALTNHPFFAKIWACKSNFLSSTFNLVKGEGLSEKTTRNIKKPIRDGRFGEDV